MEFSVLGALSVRADGEEVAVGGAKPRALLTLLLLHANRVVAPDRLIEDLWEGEPPDSAPGTLQSHIAALRRALGRERLRTRGGGYMLELAEGELDAASFEAELAEAKDRLRGGDPGAAATLLLRALGRWRGSALGEFAGASWGITEASRLEETRLVAIEALLEARLALGQPAEAVAQAESAVADHPLRERLWALLMTALYREGRQAEALRAYQRLRTHLADELGIEPSTELRTLERRILDQDPELASPAGAAPAPARDPATSALPTGVVTFLLTDVVGSTRLWDKHPAEMEQALARHDAVIRSLVDTYGGVLLKARGEGDSTFSVFGRATDAVAAARAAQRALASEPWPPDAVLDVRMALHTGEALERDGDYYGPAVNRVARLRGVAEGGQILVSRSTTEVVVDHLPDDCHLVELGSQELQDLARPETVYLLATPTEVGAGPRVSATGSPERVPMPGALAGSPFAGFHGRVREREVLGQCLKDVINGPPRLVLVAGEPGIGKTALSAEVARTAFAAGATVLYGRCDEDAGVPYRPWVEAIGHLAVHIDQSVLDRLGRRRLSDIARLVPALSERVTDLPGRTGGDPEAERYLLFGAVIALLQTAAPDAGLVLVLDDLHWADKPTLALLRHLVSTADPLPVLVIGTYRHSELSSEHPLTDVLAALRRESGVERLALGGLGDQELLAVVESAAGQQLGGAELDLVQAVYRETDGNPFYAWELILHLSESGAVSLSEGGRWLVTGDLDQMSLPDSVREVIGRRVARLGGEVKPILATAAVIGRDFDLDALVAAVDAAPDAVLDALERAESAQLVTSTARGRFTFSHALIPHTLYQDLNPTRRAQIHRRVAEAIEAMDATGTRVGELARHWAEATVTSDSSRAVDYARRAGEEALRSLAPDEALRWYGQGIALLNQQAAPDEQVRCDLLIGIGDAQRQTGDPAFRQTLLEAAALARRLDDTTRLVRAALTNTRGIMIAGHVDPERIEVLEAALEVLDPGDTPQRALLLIRLAEELAFVDDLPRRQSVADEALATARRIGDPMTLVQVLIGWSYAVGVPETIEARRALSDEAIVLADSLGDPVVSLLVFRYRYYLALASADREEADRCMAQTVALAEEIGQPTMHWDVLVQRSALLLLDGEIDRAEALATAAFELGQSTGEPDAFTLFGAQLFAIRWQQGRLPELAEMIAQVMADAPALPVVRLGLALVLVAAGRGEEVTVDLAELDALPRDGAWALGLALWTEVVARSPSVEVVEALYQRLAPFPDQVIGAPQLLGGAAAHYLGVLATLLGRFDEAGAQFAAAEAMHERLRAPFHLARTHLEWGRMLLERREPGDVERGIALVERALEGGRRYGCAGVERDAVAILESLARPVHESVVREASSRGPSNLPAERSSFIGRGEEIRLVSEMVRSARVVTLTGVGGVGKTRLAVQTAAGLTAEFPEGVWLVELAPLIDSVLVATTVASAVGAPPSAGVDAADMVCRFLAQRRALVVLDNCEHVIDAATALVDRLASEAPRVSVLATSREPLGLAGESVWRVPSLTIDADVGVGDAVALFVERAAQVQAGFVFDESTADAVTAVCRRLDGIPLAIELAAARANVMSVEQIAARLDERFRLLTRGGRTAVPRQQTLQGAMDWSYELLGPTEREFFDALGVFAGAFDLTAAAAVAEVDEFEALDLVQSLVDKSMLEVDSGRDRYRLLETLRQYAWDRLVTADRLRAVRDRHAECFMALAGAQAARMSRSGQQVDALDRLEADYDNLRAALAHHIEARQAEAAVRMARRLIGLFNIRHPAEGYGWFQQIVAISDDLPPKTRARLLADTAYAGMTVGDGQAQVQLAQAAVDAGGEDAPAIALWLLSQWNLSAGEVGPAIDWARRAVAAAAASGDETTHVVAKGQLLQALALAGEEAEFRQLVPEVMAMAERLGNPTITASSRLSMAGALAFLGSRAEAVELLERGLAEADAGGPIIASSTRSLYAFLIDDVRMAAAILHPALAVARDRLSGSHQLPPLVSAAKVLTGSGRPQLAARLLGAYERHGHVWEGNTTFHAATWSWIAASTVGAPWMRSWPASVPAHLSYTVLTDELTSKLGAESLNQELGQGARFSPSEALQLAEEALDELL